MAICVVSLFLSPTSADRFLLLKVMVFRPHLKRTPTCCIYPYIGTKTHLSTQTTPRGVIRRREKVGDSACVYIFILFSPPFRIFRSVWDFVKPLVSSPCFSLASSVNIPWSKGGKGDVDYLYAFERVVMPIAKEFAPDIILGG